MRRGIAGLGVGLALTTMSLTACRPGDGPNQGGESGQGTGTSQFDRSDYRRFTQQETIFKGFFCSAELAAESRTIQDQVDAVTEFPLDRPYNQSPKDYAYDIEVYVPGLRQDMEYLATGIEIADRYNVPCYDPAQPANDNSDRLIRVAAVERWLASGYCPEEAEAVSADAADDVVDTEIQPESIATISERNKDYYISKWHNIAQMLREAGVECDGHGDPKITTPEASVA